VDFVRCWSEKTEIRAGRFIHWLGVRASKFYDWRERYGRVNEHNGWIPRDFWLAPWEKRAIIGFHREHPLEGYRRLTFMMLDADVVAVSPSSVRLSFSTYGLPVTRTQLPKCQADHTSGLPQVCLAKTRSTFEINKMQRGCVTHYKRAPLFGVGFECSNHRLQGGAPS
jgi:hypothetical protein